MTYEEIVEESKRIRGQWSVPDEVRDKAAKELEVGQWPDDEDTAKTIRTAPKEDFEKAVSERQGRMADVTKARQTEQTLKDEDSLLGKVKSAFSSKPAEPPSAPVPLAVEPAQTPSPITLTPSPIRAPQQRASPPPVPAPPPMAHTLKSKPLPPPSPQDVPEARLLASAMNRDDRMAVADSLDRVIRKRSDLPTLENDLRQVYGKYLQGEQLEKAVTGTMTVAKKAQLHRAKPDELSPIATLAEQYKKKFPQEAAPKVGPEAPSAPVPGLPEYARAPMQEPEINYDLPEDALTAESPSDAVADPEHRQLVSKVADLFASYMDQPNDPNAKGSLQDEDFYRKFNEILPPDKHGYTPEDFGVLQQNPQYRGLRLVAPQSGGSYGEIVPSAGMHSNSKARIYNEGPPNRPDPLDPHKNQIMRYPENMPSDGNALREEVYGELIRRGYPVLGGTGEMGGDFQPGFNPIGFGQRDESVAPSNSSQPEVAGETPDWLRPAEPPPSIPNVPLQFTDKAGAPLREQAQPMGNTIGQNLTEITNNYMQGVGEIPASALRAVAEASATLDKFLPEAMKNPATVEERMAYKMGETVTRLAKEAFPTDPARQKEFLVAVLPRALGSMTGFLIGGVAGAVAEAPVATTMVLGALAGGDEGYQDAKKSGADEGTKEKAFWMNAGVGTSEAVPIGHMLGRFNQATGGRFLHALKTGGIAAAEEFLQEFFQTTAGNVIAKDILEYDKQRNRLEGAGEAGEAGGAAGWIMGLITGAIGGKRAKAQHEQAETPAQPVERPAVQQRPQPVEREAPVPQVLRGRPAERQATEAAALVPETLETRKGQPYRIPQERPQAVEAPVPVERPQAVEAPVPVERPKPETKPAPIETKAPEIETKAPEIETKGPVSERPMRSYEMDTEDAGTIPVRVKRNKDGSVSIIDLGQNGVNTEYPAAFVKDKSDEDLLQYTYEPIGFRGATETSPTAKRETVAPPEVSGNRETPAPSPESAPVPVEAEAPKTQTFELNFQEGERVTYESKGKPVTGTIVGFDNDELTVQVDQITKPGGVPIKRKEYVKITNPTLKRLDAPRLIEDSAPVPLETAAHEAATSPQNDLPEPTEAQKEAGNYQKGHVKIAGLDISIENPQGSTRSGTDASGKPWSVEMQSHYGYIKGTVGKDKDHIDVFVKPGTPEAYNGPVFVVDQVDPKTGKFDEHKAILGAVDIDEAKKMYRENYAKDWKGLGTISATPMREFRDWLNRGNTKKPFHQSKESTVLAPEEPAKLPADLIKPAPSKTQRPDRALDIDMAEQEKRPEAAAEKPATPDQRRSVFLGKNGQRNITFADPIHAELFDFTSKLKKHIDGTKKFDLDHATSRLKAKLNLPADANVGAIAQEYRKQILDQAKAAAKGETVEASAPTLIKPAPSKTQRPDRALDIDMAEQEQRPEAAVSPEGQSFIDRFKSKGFIYGTVKSGDADRLASLLDAYKLPYEQSGKGKITFKHLPGKPFKLGGYHVSDRADAVPTKAEEAAPVPVSSDVKENPANITKAEESPKTPLETTPAKGTTIEATPQKEATREPEQPRLEDARSPKEVSAQDVPGVEAGRESEPVPVDAAGDDRDTTRRPGGQRARPSRGARDGAGSDVSASGERPADTGATDTTVSRPSKPKAEEKPDEPDLPAGTDYRLTPDYSIPKGAKTKYKANVAAIKLLKQIEAEGRKATPAEQETLAQYTGWGGLPQAFQWSRDWDTEYSQLSELLTQEEYAAARASTPNAHYTDPSTIRAMYAGLKHLGFKSGKLLEPGAGIGHFLGSIPGDLRSKVQKTAVEMDSLSARIMAQLYQRANVLHSPYQETVIPENFFDVAIGNVPFANVQVFDPHNKELSKLKLSLHDYYFAKAISQVRPGGLVAFITSRYTLDKLNGKLRDYIAKKADFVGAIRLPNTQFKEIANTDVVTDIIVLQRREDGTPAKGEPWAETKTMRVGVQEVAVNEYFAAHPEQILGKAAIARSMYRDNEFTVEPDGRNMEEAITEAFQRMPEKILRPRNAPASTTPRGLLEALEASDDVKDGAYTIQNNALYLRRGAQFVPVEDVTPNNLERAKGLIGLREQTREVFKTQLSDSDHVVMVKAREELNKRYDRFVKKFGPVSGRLNKALFREDPDYPTLQALERKYDPKTNTAQKADIFAKRVIEFRPSPTRAESPKDAMLVSMNGTGGLDFARMSELTGSTEEDLQKALKGVVYKSPSGSWEPADAYLSGNVRKKLKEAEAAAKLDPTYKEHVDALKAAIPADLAPSQIDVKLGHGWVPTSVYEAFIEHLFGISRATVKYNAQVGAYAINAPMGYSNTKNESVWGTGRYPGIDILNDAMHSKLPTVRDKLPDDKTVVNEKETLAAREKLSKMQEEFRKWMWSDPARAEPLARLYNDEFNAVRLREFDGSHLTLPGQNPAITLKKHQKDVIWRALQSGNTLLAHVVGAGKTFEMIGIAMEARRLRMANKPMFVVPNHLVEQWRDEILTLYPAAKVLMTSKDDFKKENRRVLAGRIATGDWDAVLISHSQMSRLPVSLERFKAFVDEQVEVLDDYLRELNSQRGDKQANRNLTKELEKAKERLLSKLKARQAAVTEKADQGVNFEETGVDMLLVDEADLFKNLWFPTRMTRVAGLPNSESQRSYDMFLKTQYLNKLTNQRGVIFATGTPVSNSMAEVFTMQRYLQPATLEESGLQHFDAWARQYGNVVTSMELAPDGSGYRPRSRFAEFVNVPELTQQFRQVMDVKTQEDLSLPVPKLKTGKPINNTYKPSPALVAYTKELIDRAAHLKTGVDPRVDNMLKITGDGRNAALDIRLRVPGAPEDKSGKIVGMVNNVSEIYKRTTDVKGTQLIFLDLSTPKGEGKAKPEAETDAPPGDDEIESGDEAVMRGSVYSEIKKKLMKKGIPEKEIAFIHDADTDTKKGKLFAAVNAGTVRVLIGSTEKMGAGTNVQQRMVALHNLDAPWRPRDIEQRNGRGVRQGNLLYKADPENFRFEVHNYATEAPSFDVYMWQTLESKAKTITQIMKGDPNIRSIQDVDSNVLSFAEMKAIASGNPMILERVKVDTELKKLTMLRAQGQDAKLHMRFELKAIPGKIQYEREQIERISKDVAVLDKHPAEPFTMTVDKKTFDEPEEAGKSILKIISEYIGDNSKRSETARYEIGTYRGFPIKVTTYLDNDSSIMLAGGLATSNFQPDISPAGLITRMNNVLSHLPKWKTDHTEKIAKLEATEAELQTQIDAPFEYIDKIDELEARLDKIDKDLDLTNKDEGVVAVSDESAKPDIGTTSILKNQRGSIPLGSLVPALKKKPADVVVGASGPVTFADPATEKRFQVAKQGVKPETFVQRVKDGINEIRKQTREFPELPDVPEYSQLRTSLLTLQKMKGIAADRTIRQLKSIIGDFGPNKMDVFTRKVLLDDLVREAEEGRSLPFGLTKDSVEQERDKVDALLAQNPDIADAVDQRKAAWRGVKNRYQVAMRSIGLDKLADRLSKEDYFRHQVLEYANERRQHPAGAGKELKSPTGRGFNRQRHGSEKDINANYLQADFEVMAQMEHDIAVAKTIRLVDKEHNIASDLKKAAKQANTLEVEKRIAGNLQLEEKWADFKKRIGMGMSKVREALGLNKQAILSFDQLKEYAEQEGHPAQGGALMAFKAMSERRQWIKEFLGKDFQTWEDRIPEGYQVWQPEPGNVFFMAETIPHRLARQLTEALVPSLNISAEQLRAVMAMGSPKEQYVIPDEVYHTLKAMAQPIPPIWQRTIRQVQGHWKQVMLLAPRRFLRYNLRNLTGDADAVFAGNPSAMKTLPKAMHDLWPVFFGKEAPLTGEVKEWFDRGGFQTTLQVQEMGDLNELKLFRDSLEREQKGGLLSIPARIFNGYWKNARLATDYREAMLRYANYLNYLEQMRGNANQRPNNFGASIRENVMALPDLRDRAFKLSNELLGAYDRVSAIGQNLRNYWYPFFSWVEVNFRRYKQMIKNAFKDIGSAKLARLGGVATLKAAKWLVRFSALWAALQAWNMLMFPGDDDELDEATRNRPHILFGRSDDGKIRYLSGIGAMGDLLSWFGLDVAPAVTRDVLNGKMTVPEALKQMAKAPVNKLVQGVTPLVKTPAELIARESTYPDVFHPRPIQDRGEYLAQQLTLSKEYGKLKGKPQQPDDFAGLVIQRQDPGSAAYTDWSGIESRFLEKIGKERGIHFRSPRSEALRNVSRAITQKDPAAEAYWREKYVELGGTKKGMEASVRALAPLYGMSRVERDQLLATLDAADRKILKRAETYYKEKLTQVLPDWERSKLLRKLASKGWLSKEEADVPSFLNPEVPASDSSLGLAAD